MSTSLPDPVALRVLPLADPPNRMALPVPPAVRFVTPVKALASTMYGGLPLVAVVVRLAVVIPLKETAIPSVEFSELLVRVKPAFLLAVTMPDAVSVSDPLPVQALTVNVLLELVAVRLAVVIPLKPSDMPSVEDSELLARVKLALLLAATVSDPPPPVNVPAPVQLDTMKVSLAVPPVRLAKPENGVVPAVPALVAV